MNRAHAPSAFPWVVLWHAFKPFYRFAPKRQAVLLVLMTAQGLTAGIGLLLLIPLLHLAEFASDENTSQVLAIVIRRIDSLGLEINLEAVLIFYTLLITGIATLRYQLAVLSSHTQQTYISFLRHRLFSLLMNTRWTFIVNRKIPDFIHCLTGQVQLVGYASHLMLTWVSQLIMVAALTLLSFLLSWQLTLLALGMALPLLGTLLPFNRLIHRSGNAQLKHFKSVFQLLSEQLNGLKSIKSFSREHDCVQKLDCAGQALEAQSAMLARMTALTQWLYLVGAVVIFSVFFFVSQRWLDIPLPTTLLLLVIFSRVLQQVSHLQQTYQQLVHKLPAFADVQSMLDACEQEQETLCSEDFNPPFRRSIRFDKISYAYPGSKINVLQNLSGAIPKDQTTVLIGPSGSGKTTLADLVAGFLSPTAGHIYCDDTLLDDKSRLAWRQHIAYVTQDAFLFHDTIRNNLSWVSEDPVTDEALWQVLTLAAAQEFVATLPDGLNTYIGDRGIRLSGGERQRLVLARALLAKPQLLILDEATSALDDENEAKIRQALTQLHGQLTVLIIAHRGLFLSLADQIIDLGELHHSLTHQDHSHAVTS